MEPLYCVSIRPQPAEDEFRFELAGEAGPRDVKRLHAELHAALRRDGPVAIDTRRLESIDASVVQLLLAGLKSAERRQGRVSVVAQAGGALPTALQRLGIASEFVG